MKIPPAVTTALTALARETAARANLLRAPTRAEAKAVGTDWRTRVAAEATEARMSPTFDAQEIRKQQARARLQQLGDWLKIVRRLHAQNPEGMARALTQALKDLKAAVKAYRDAGGEEMAMAGAAAGAAFASPVVGPAPTRASADPAGSDEAEAAGDADQPERNARPEATDEPGAEDSNEDPNPDDEPAALDFAALAAAAYRGGRSLFDAVVTEVKKRIGEDGLQFLKEVKGLVKDIADLLLTARTQAAARRKDKATDAAVEEADKAMKDLNETMDDMERGIRQAAPTAGMSLSVAA